MIELDLGSYEAATEAPATKTTVTKASDKKSPRRKKAPGEKSPRRRKSQA